MIDISTRDFRKFFGNCETKNSQVKERDYREFFNKKK